MEKTLVKMLKTEETPVLQHEEMPDYSSIGYSLDDSMNKKEQILANLKKNDIDVFTKESVERYKKEKLDSIKIPYINRWDKLKKIYSKLQSSFIKRALLYIVSLGMSKPPMDISFSSKSNTPVSVRYKRNKMEQLYRCLIKNSYIMNHESSVLTGLDRFKFGPNERDSGFFAIYKDYAGYSDEDGLPRKEKYVMLNGQLYEREKTASWKMSRIEEYKQIIPKYVLDNAVKIKQMYPDARFSIDELKMNSPVEFSQTVQKQKTLDPFLVANINGMEFYVDVWLEGNFKAHRVFEN